MSPTISEPLVSYVICTNPRSGSWLLSEALESTELAGRPREWFNPLQGKGRRPDERNDELRGQDFAEYLRQVIAEATTSNGVCGLKIHYYQLWRLHSQVRSLPEFGELPFHRTINAVLPKVRLLWLTREDKSRQAISYFLAARTNEWWRLRGTERSSQLPLFSPEEVYDIEQALIQNDLAWEALFRLSGQSPHRVSYERLSQDYQGTVLELLDWLDVGDQHTLGVSEPRLERQSDLMTERWLQGYRELEEIDFFADRASALATHRLRQAWEAGNYERVLAAIPMDPGILRRPAVAGTSFHSGGLVSPVP
jgi:LPS sulfotransferase NodH